MVRAFATRVPKLSTNARELIRHPFPEGWYFVATRRSVERVALMQRSWLGRDIVVWSDGDGQICVAESLCPHLGSQLGPEAGGRVRNGRLVCPFHGFRYDIGGHCVATPNGPAPPVRLTVFETREILGMIFAWHGLSQGEPRWDLPPEPDTDDWCEPGFRSLRFQGHPQDTTENVVDLAHLNYVHDYDNVARIRPITIDGPYLQGHFAFCRTRKVLGALKLRMDVTAVAHIHGLGYSFVEVRERTIGLRTRLWVLVTPLDGTEVEQVIVSQVRNYRRLKGWAAALAILPTRSRTRIINRCTLNQELKDVNQDVAIWQRRRHLEHPRLTRADGEIMQFRRYCEQFYAGRPDDGSDRRRSGMRRAAPAHRRARQAPVRLARGER